LTLQWRHPTELNATDAVRLGIARFGRVKYCMCNKKILGTKKAPCKSEFEISQELRLVSDQHFKF